ncbi:helix-turn-helix domain-containing protein [Christiangramia sabulilitoris]|uniref:Helix-turn-helix domain-containing protein n=2 Tax=Christiangramia sabulilitoris TaxID=2583991 RepID=A0A550I998_9FLAO|nr:helix-turn-helix domain-containing protein [Christiangramia sabulilitoris]
MVKSNRIQKGYTQAILAEKTKLSLRSIQRIEKGDVCPREYTLKVLSEILEVPLASFKKEESPIKIPVNKKVILSTGSGLIILLCSLAFLSQSAVFPETNFESYLFWCAITVMICVTQWIIWNYRSLKL